MSRPSVVWISESVVSLESRGIVGCALLATKRVKRSCATQTTGRLIVDMASLDVGEWTNVDLGNRFGPPPKHLSGVGSLPYMLIA